MRCWDFFVIDAMLSSHLRLLFDIHSFIRCDNYLVFALYFTDALADWVRHSGLAKRSVDLLREDGYESLEDFALLTVEDIEEAFQRSGKLPHKECQLLKRAIRDPAVARFNTDLAGGMYYLQVCVCVCVCVCVRFM